MRRATTSLKGGAPMNREHLIRRYERNCFSRLDRTTFQRRRDFLVFLPIRLRLARLEPGPVLYSGSAARLVFVTLGNS
jgi:hypothetical protein